MFHEERCDFCGDCLARCKYLEFDKESGSAAMRKLAAGEKSPWIYDCVTCMACDEYCPTNARPFDLIMQRLEAAGDFTDRQIGGGQIMPGLQQSLYHRDQALPDTCG